MPEQFVRLNLPPELVAAIPEAMENEGREFADVVTGLVATWIQLKKAGSVGFPRIAPLATIAQGESWYREFQAELEANNMGDWVVIGVEDGSYVVANIEQAAKVSFRLRHGNVPTYARRIGH